MKGCTTAAIIRMWLSTDNARLPVRPHGLAQSNPPDGSGLRCGAPSNVMAPQQKLLAASISARTKPSAASSSKEGSSSAPRAIPNRSTQKSSPNVHLLNVDLMSNARRVRPRRRRRRIPFRRGFRGSCRARWRACRDPAHSARSWQSQQRLSRVRLKSVATVDGLSPTMYATFRANSEITSRFNIHLPK
jgi:hypothetical protein